MHSSPTQSHGPIHTAGGCGEGLKRAKSEGWGTGHSSAARQERKAERPRIFIHLRTSLKHPLLFPATGVNLYTLSLSSSPCWVERMGRSKPPASSLKNSQTSGTCMAEVSNAVGPAWKDIHLFLKIWHVKLKQLSVFKLLCVLEFFTISSVARCCWMIFIIVVF